MTKSSGGLTNKAKGFRLPSFSQPSEMPDGQISNTRKFNYWGLHASKPIGSLRPIVLNSVCLRLEYRNFVQWPDAHSDWADDVI